MCCVSTTLVIPVCYALLSNSVMSRTESDKVSKTFFLKLCTRQVPPNYILTFLFRNICIDFLTSCEIWPNKTEKKIPYSAKQLKINKHRRDIHAVVMLFASWLSAQQLRPPYLGWQGHNSLIAIVSYHHGKMWKRKNVSSSDWYWTFDVRRQEIELNHQGPLKMAIR